MAGEDAIEESLVRKWGRLLRAIQARVFAYDFAPERAQQLQADPCERMARAAAAAMAVLFFVVSAWLVATGKVDNKPTTASTGLTGIHASMTLDVSRWFAEGIWWYQRQTPTPLPFTAIGFLFMAVGYSPTAVLILHAALGAWGGYLLFRVSQDRFGGATGLIACLLLYTLPMFVFVTLSGWTFVWATTSLLFAIAMLDRFHTSKRLGWYFLAAVGIGCAGMSRPENYVTAVIFLVFCSARLRYAPLFLLIAFAYPLAQYLHNNVYLGAAPALRILNDARAGMTLYEILSEWGVNVYRSISVKSLSPLFHVLAGVGLVLFGIPRRRFLFAIIAYFFLAFAAAYSMRRLSFNHEGYYYAHLILVLPFLAHAIWRCGWLVAAGLRRISVPPRLAWAGAAPVLAALLLWNAYDLRASLRSRLFFQIRPEVKAARDFLRKNAAPDDPIALDYVGETSWLVGELESDVGRPIWFYASNSKQRPKVNAARADAPQADIDAMNVWVAAGFREWARQYRPKYLFVPSEAEWREHSSNSKTATQYKMFGLRPAIGQDDFAAVALDNDGSILRGTRVFANDRVWILEMQTVLSTTYTVLDADFDDWTTGVPAGWTTSPAGAVDVIDEPARGRVVRLRSEPGASPALGLKLRDSAFVPGRAIEVEVDMHSGDPGHAVLIVGFGASDGSNFKPEHPGDGAWRRVRVRAEVPANAAPGVCYVNVVVRPGASAPVLADNLVVRILREADGQPR